ncbi:MAG: hypothetical protein AB1630_02970 [bacterium]
MAQAIALDIYQYLEGRLGKEEADKVASAIEVGLDVIEEKASSLAISKKLELRDELTKELASKADLQVVRTELKGEIDKLNMKINFLIVLTIIALTLMNPVMAEIIKGLLNL